MTYSNQNTLPPTDKHPCIGCRSPWPGCRWHCDSLEAWETRKALKELGDAHAR